MNITFAVMLKKGLELYGQFDTLNQLVNVLTQQDMQDILNEIGNKHLDAGLRALNDAKRSTVPEEHLRDARVCFRLAFEFFSTRGLRIFGLVIKEPDHQKMYISAFLVAYCNVYFGDFENAREYLYFSEQSFLKYYKKEKGILEYEIKPHFGEPPRVRVAYELSGSKNRDIERLNELNEEKEAFEQICSYLGRTAS